MAFCNQCGTELPDGARFCANCGAAVAGTAAPPETVAARPTQSFQPAPGSAPVARSGGGMGWILPALVAVAAIAIAYLMFAPKPSIVTTETGQTAAEGKGAAPSTGARTGDETGGDADGRAVDEASDAATVASGNTRAAGATVSAAVLDSAFNSDPDGAAARYAGPIRVSGIIASMVQPGATPALSMEGRTRFNFMIVNFPAGYRERLAPLSKGQFISVACDEVRSLGGTTILSGCLLG